VNRQECVTIVVEKATASGQSTQSPSVSTLPQPIDNSPNIRTFAIYGIISAILGLLIFPEIVDSVAIILGAYAWRKEQGNRGLYIIILGIICMLVGIYLIAYTFAAL
jgi:uncharacterized membrane protein HdeD (DUF308 family)